MNVIHNPFVVKGRIPDEYFCDRVVETEKLTRELINGNDVVVMSSRRLGKTGLIQHCFDQPIVAERYYTFFVDILETSSLRDFTYLLSRQIFETLKPLGSKFTSAFVQTLKSLQAGWGYDPTTGLPKFTFSLGAINEPEVTLNEIFTLMENADKRCLVAIDEFQQIVKKKKKNIEAILRGHIQHLSNCDFIFAGSERHLLAEMFASYGRPFYNSTSALNLNPILKEKYVEFVINNFQKFQKTISEEDTGSVYDLYAGNTFCLQKTFNVAFDLTKKGKACTRETLQLTVDEILDDKERDFQNILSHLTERPKELLVAIAIDGKVDSLTSNAFIRKHKLQSASSVQSAVKQLLQDDLLTFSLNEKGKKTYQVADPFLQLWLKRSFGDGFEINHEEH